MASDLDRLAAAVPEAVRAICARLRQAGFVARRSLDDGIRELLKGYRMLGRGQYRNAG